MGSRAADTPVLVTVDGPLVAALTTARATGVNLVLIVAEAVGPADLVLVPVQKMTPHDLRAVGAAVDLARRAQRPLVFIINRTKPRVRLTGEAAIALRKNAHEPGPAAGGAAAGTAIPVASQTN